MPESRVREFKRPFILVAILLIVIALFIWNRWRTNRDISETDQVRQVESRNRFAGQAIDQTVLEDQKFKDLKPIPKWEADLGPDISADELAKVKRRYGNPFKAF